jgi:probable rRNA maturation factor
MIRFDCITPVPNALNRQDLARLGRVLSKVVCCGRQAKTIGVRFVSLQEMRGLNRAFRDKDKPTDVLSFPFIPLVGENEKDGQAGDLAICEAFAAVEAKRRSIGLREELIRLFVHGTLHLMGYDHETVKEEEEMFALQEDLVAKCLPEL